MDIQVSKATAVLSCSSIIKMLRTKEATLALHSSGNNPIWPFMLDIEESPKRKIPVVYRPPTAEMLAYVDFSVTTSGILFGIKVSQPDPSLGKKRTSNFQSIQRLLACRCLTCPPANCVVPSSCSVNSIPRVPSLFASIHTAVSALFYGALAGLCLL